MKQFIKDLIEFLIMQPYFLHQYGKNYEWPGSTRKRHKRELEEAHQYYHDHNSPEARARNFLVREGK